MAGVPRSGGNTKTAQELAADPRLQEAIKLVAGAAYFASPNGHFDSVIGLVMKDGSTLNLLTHVTVRDLADEDVNLVRDKMHITENK